MGLPMAQRVIRAGHPLVTTFHRNRKPADELAGLGAEIVLSPAEVARRSDVIITILPAGSQVEECFCGPNGVLEGLSKGKAVIEMTTCAARNVVRVAERIQVIGARLLDAPVSGGTAGAEKGTLTIMAGGDSALLDEFRPLLSAMGTHIAHVGAIGSGKAMKIVNQALAAIHILAIGEVFALGIRNGLDKNMIYHVIKESSGYSRMMDARLEQFLFAGSFVPGFKLDLMKKDVLLASDAARDLNCGAPLTSSAVELFVAASSAGYGDADFSRVAEYVAGLSGATLGARDQREAGDQQ